MNISKAEFIEMYNSHSNDYICAKLGISQPTLISYLKKAGIKLKGKGNRNSKLVIR